MATATARSAASGATRRSSARDAVLQSGGRKPDDRGDEPEDHVVVRLRAGPGGR